MSECGSRDLQKTNIGGRLSVVCGAMQSVDNWRFYDMTTFVTFTSGWKMVPRSNISLFGLGCVPTELRVPARIQSFALKRPGKRQSKCRRCRYLLVVLHCGRWCGESDLQSEPVDGKGRLPNWVRRSGNRRESGWQRNEFGEPD